MENKMSRNVVVFHLARFKPQAFHDVQSGLLPACVHADPDEFTVISAQGVRGGAPRENLCNPTDTLSFPPQLLTEDSNKPLSFKTFTQLVLF